MQRVILNIALKSGQPISEIAQLSDPQLMAVLEILGG